MHPLEFVQKISLRDLSPLVNMKQLLITEKASYKHDDVTTWKTIFQITFGAFFVAR